MSQTVNKGGVRTDEGKAISKYNAQKHAVLRETITEYEKGDFRTVYDDLAEELQPSGRLQEMMVEVVASNYIKLNRITKAEAELIKEALSPEKFDLPELGGKEYKPSVDAETVEKLSLYSRYQTATENRIYRAVAVLKQLQL